MNAEPHASSEGADDEPPPRVPRGRGLYVSAAQIVRIAMLVALLVGIAVLGRPCADGVSRFIVSFSPPPEEAPGATEGLDPGEVRRLSDDEIRERFPSLVGRDGGSPEPASEAGEDPDADAGPGAEGDPGAAGDGAG